jgi:hypothetical protein
MNAPVEHLEYEWNARDDLVAVDPRGELLDELGAGRLWPTIRFRWRRGAEER